MTNPASPKTILERGLTRRQKTALRKTPPIENIRTRREGDKDLSYLEGWYVIAEANRIFGTECWDRVTLTTNCVWQGRQEGEPSCAYTARVRVCVRAGAYTFVREGSGFGQARANTLGEAHGAALKAAETDATKRALATLGAPFGLLLYDTSQSSEKQSSKANESEQVAEASAQPAQSAQSHNPLWIVRSANGEAIGVFRNPIRACSCLRSGIQETNTTAELEALYALNRRLLARLRSECPDLRSDADQHYSEILSRLFQARLKKLAVIPDTGACPKYKNEESVSAPSGVPLIVPVALTDALQPAAE